MAKYIDCDLCMMRSVISGKDKLLFRSLIYYIVENGNTDGYSRRISFTSVRHESSSSALEKMATTILRDYIESILHIPAADFFIQKTMRTYPDHFHIHAYVLPKIEELWDEEAARDIAQEKEANESFAKHKARGMGRKHA